MYLYKNANNKVLKTKNPHTRDDGGDCPFVIRQKLHARHARGQGWWGGGGGGIKTRIQ